MSSNRPLLEKRAKKNHKLNMAWVLQSCFSKLPGQLALNFKGGEAPASTFENLSHKSKRSVLPGRNRHFPYWDKLYVIYLPITKPVWDSSHLLVSALLNAWKLLTDTRNACIRSCNTFWFDGNSSVPSWSAGLHAGPLPPHCHCIARPRLQVLEHMLQLCIWLDLLLQGEYLCLKSRICLSAKAQHRKGRTICAINDCAAN